MKLLIHLIITQTIAKKISLLLTRIFIKLEF
jgi:hypothetical protein